MRNEFKSVLKLLFTLAFINSIGGLSLELASKKLIQVVPIIILLPALSHMCGSFGTIISSKFTSLLFKGKISKKGIKDNDLKILFKNLFYIVIISSIYISIFSFVISPLRDYKFNFSHLIKIPIFVLIVSLSLFIVNFNVAIFTGLYLYRKKKDPDDFLVPITTTISDFGSIVLITILSVMFL